MEIIFQKMGQEKRPVVISVICLMVGVFMEIMVPFMISSFIDMSVEAGEISRLYQSGVLMAALLGAALVSGLISGRYTARAASDFAADLRGSIYECIQKLPFETLDHYTMGSLIARMTTDVTSVQNAVQTILGTFLRNVFLMAGTLLVSVFISPVIGILFVTALVVSGLAAVAISGKALPLFAEGLGVYDGLNQSVKENIAAMRVVKAFVREGAETDRFREGSQHMYQCFVKAERITVLSNPIMMFAMDSCLIAVVWFGSRGVISARMSAGTLILLFTYTANLMVSLLSLFGALYSIVMTIPSMQRIAEILECGQEETVSGEERELEDGSVSFEHVNFNYGEKRVLTDIHVYIPSGAVVGVVGATGSGKSTFAQLIPGLYPVSDGKVTVGGIDVSRQGMGAWRERIGFVEQNHVLFSGTIEENIRWGNPAASKEEVIRAAGIASADEFIGELPEKYGTRIERGGMNFSGGQRQRLCIARAIVKRPDILILDDATSAVDTLLDQKIHRAIRAELPETTIVVISQKIRQVMECDCILVFDGGRICGQGTHEELLEGNQLYREIYESQQVGGDFDAD